MPRHFLSALILLFCLALTKPSVGQDSLSADQVKSAIKTALDSFSKSNDVQTIGALLLNPIIPHYFNIHNLEVTAINNLKIDRVTINLQDGYISDINVYAEGKHFTNLNAPIGIRQARFEAHVDKLLNIENPTEYIWFNEVLHEDSLTSYTPADGFYQLTPELNKLVLYRKVGVNTVLDVRLYTDALGLFGGSSNGIVQTDVRIKQYIHRKNINNRYAFSLQYVKANFNASKFTDNSRYVDGANLSRTALLQKSFLNAEIATDLLHFNLAYKSTNIGYIDGGGGIHEASLAYKGDTTTALTAEWFVETGVNVKSSDNAGFNLYCRIIDNYSPQTAFADNTKGRIFIKFGTEVFWNPWNNDANRLFARMNYLFATRQTDKPNDFFQLQIGYSVLLSSLIKTK
jgi:hypothetical protein